MSSLSRSRPNRRARDMLIRQQPSSTPATFHIAYPEKTIARPWEGGHSLGWVAWLVCSLVVVSHINHPFYLAIIWGCTLLIWNSCAKPGPLGDAFRLFMLLGVWIFGMHIVFSIFTVSFIRGETLLWTMTTWQLPHVLGGISLGGAVTLEQLLFGALRGFKLWTLMLLFGTFNACVNHYRLIRRTPGFLIHLGITIIISLAFVPQTILRLKAIREAQRLRGQHFRSWRDALPLLVPLISSGLERALMLAEAMESRGYGRTLPQLNHARQINRQRWLMGFSICCLLLGFVNVFLYSSQFSQTLGSTLMLLACSLIGYSWLRLSNLSQRSTYNREQWTMADTLVCLGGILAIVGVFWARSQRLSLHFAVFPRVEAPGFEPLIGIVLLGISMPAWFWHKKAPVREQRTL